MSSAINTPWKKAVGVEPREGFRLHIIMEDNEKLDLDLAALITERGAFWRLKNLRYFRKVAVDPLGGLCWPEGEDISPTKMLVYNTPKSNNLQNHS